MIQGLRRFHVGDRLSEMAIFNNTVYLAGQVPDDPSQDIRGQTAEVRHPGGLAVGSPRAVNDPSSERD